MQCCVPGACIFIELARCSYAAQRHKLRCRSAVHTCVIFSAIRMACISGMTASESSTRARPGSGPFPTLCRGSTSVLLDILYQNDICVCRYQFQVPPYFTLMVRSLTILEGIALATDPNYKARPICSYDSIKFSRFALLLA